MADKKQKSTVTFVAAGDVFPSGKVVYQDGTIQEVITYKPEAVFEDVAPIFRNTDVVFCNLESALADRGASQMDRSASFMSRPENITLLKEAKIDIVSLANNHSIDFGPEAIFQTMDLLDKYGVSYIIMPEVIAAPDRITGLHRWRPVYSPVEQNSSFDSADYLRKVYDEGTMIYEVIYP